MSGAGARRSTARAALLGALPMVVGALVLFLLPDGVEGPTRWSLAITAGALAA